jgi:hypothetical protein
VPSTRARGTVGRSGSRQESSCRACGLASVTTGPRRSGIYASQVISYVYQAGSCRLGRPIIKFFEPAEHLWSLTNEALVNKCFADLEDLEEAQLARCAVLQRQPQAIRSATLFPWWPRRLKKRQGPRSHVLHV